MHKITNIIISTLELYIIIILGIHTYADQPRTHKVCIISLECEHIKLICIDNLLKYNNKGD